MKSDVAIQLYVGGHAGTLPGKEPGERDREDLNGKRMFTAAHSPNVANYDATLLEGMLDSGAFTDAPKARLTPEKALDRQLSWEGRASNMWGFEFKASALVSYDLLIDETWVFGERYKRRWNIAKGEWAVSQTIAAAHYLASQRELLSPRHLVLSCQGVDAIQYAECTQEVLKVAQVDDIIGLGGWCIIGRQKSLLPEFWRTLHRVLPLISCAGIKRVHIFGVLYFPALGGLTYLGDKYGLEISTDSTAPVLACTYKDKKRSGARATYWRDNVEWWKTELTKIRSSKYYKLPPDLAVGRQLTFLEHLNQEEMEVA